jgi:hypothetical protein
MHSLQSKSSFRVILSCQSTPSISQHARVYDIEQVEFLRYLQSECFAVRTLMLKESKACFVKVKWTIRRREAVIEVL